MQRENLNIYISLNIQETSLKTDVSAATRIPGSELTDKLLVYTFPYSHKAARLAAPEQRGQHARAARGGGARASSEFLTHHLRDWLSRAV